MLFSPFLHFPERSADPRPRSILNLFPSAVDADAVLSAEPPPPPFADARIRHDPVAVPARVAGIICNLPVFVVDCFFTSFQFENST
jgi:hypothetical protein